MLTAIDKYIRKKYIIDERGDKIKFYDNKNWILFSQNDIFLSYNECMRQASPPQFIRGDDYTLLRRLQYP